MTQGNPLVSVIIPIFNGADFLAEAVDSIVRQEYEPLEIIMVDDGSTDESAEAIRSIRGNIQYIHQEHQGVAAARNTGLKAARGELIGFLDQDDLWPEGRLGGLIAHFGSEMCPMIVFGKTRMLRLTRTSGGDSQHELLGDPFFSLFLGSALYSSRVFESLGLLDEGLKYFDDDFDLLLRALEQQIPVQYLDLVTLLYRLHGHNSVLTAPPGKGHVEAVKKSLDRRRAGGVDPSQSLPGIVSQLPKHTS